MIKCEEIDRNEKNCNQKRRTEMNKSYNDSDSILNDEIGI